MNSKKSLRIATLFSTDIPTVNVQNDTNDQGSDAINISTAKAKYIGPQQV